MRHWTQQEREKQAEAIRRWAPWQQSTGPKTDEGKQVAAANSLKHGMRSAEAIEERKAISDLMKALAEGRDAILGSNRR